jgi:hypothetical protein
MARRSIFSGSPLTSLNDLNNLLIEDFGEGVDVIELPEIFPQPFKRGMPEKPFPCLPAKLGFDKNRGPDPIRFREPCARRLHGLLRNSELS